MGCFIPGYDKLLEPNVAMDHSVTPTMKAAAAVAGIANPLALVAAEEGETSNGMHIRLSCSR